MAKPRKPLEDLRKKYGLGGNTKPTSTKSDSNKPTSDKSPKWKQSNSSAPTLDDLRKKYGVSDNAKSASTKNNNTKKNNSSSPTLEDLRKKYGVSKTTATKPLTAFDTETKNAYTSYKSKANNKTTFASDMTEKDRKKRINEIESEIRQLNTTLHGIGRAAAYGSVDSLKSKKDETQMRIAELSEELKTLQRTGTFTAAELKQFEIDDAKAKKSALPSYNPTARITLAEADTFKKNVSEHYALDKEIEKLEREKELYEDISKFGDVVNDDNFGGQWRANYRSNDLSREADKAFSEYIKNPTEENLQIAYAYDAFSKEYAKNNEKALDDENVKASWLTKSMAGYLPQFKDQIVPELVGGGIGLVAGGNVGASIGAGLGTYSQSYDVIRGSVYRTLLAEGVDKDIALSAANDEAFISSLIESGETALGWLLAGGTKAVGAISNAAKASVAKGSTNAATKFVASLASGATNRAASKAAAEVSRPLWSKGLRVAGGIVGNALGEYGEEFAQGAVSKANRERAMQDYNITSPDDNLWSGGAKVIGSALSGNDPETFAELHEQGKEGFKIGLMMGGSNTIVNNVVANYANRKTIKAQNEFVDTIINDEESLNALIEEGKASGEGTVSAKIAEEVEQTKAQGKAVTREQVKSLIESNNVYIKAEEQTAQPDTLEQAAKDVVAERNRKSTPTYERLEAFSRNNEPITVEEVKKATGFGEEGSKIVADLANSDGMTFSQAERTVKTAYLAGFSNVEGASVNFASDTQINAFTAGKKDRLMQDTARKENAKNATVYDSGVVQNDNFKKLSQASQELLSTLAKDHKMSVEVKDSILAAIVNGKRYEADASHLDGRMEGSMSTEKPLIKWAIHEDGHRMEQMATDEWNVLANALYERAERLGRRAELGVSQGMLFDDMKAQHDEAGLSMDTSGYFGEVVMRELETIFASPEEFNSWRAELDSNAQVKTAWQKFMDFLVELIEDVKRLVANRKLSKEARAEAKTELAELERIKELYAEAYTATRDAVAERAKSKSAETNSTKNLEIKINEDYNGNIRHSLYSYPKLTKSEWALLNDRLEIELHNDNNFIDDYTKWLYAVKNNTRVFAIYGIGWGDDATPLYAVGGKKAEKTYNKMQNFMEGEDEEFNGSREDFESWLNSYSLNKGATGNNISDDGNRGTNIGNGSIHSEQQTSNGKRIDGGSAENSNAVKHFLKDSEGNTLTKEQAEYFKDSKVRDENGNLLVMYQGASEDFTVFDRKKSSYANLYGRGFYFTKSENHASQYGNTKAYYLNIKHPVSTTETTISKSQLRKFLQAVIENEDYSFENYGYGATVDSVLTSVYGKSDFLMLNDVSQTAIGDLVGAIELFNEVNGTDYDGIMLDTETVTFNSEQAKLTTNENPTSNPDTRFSLANPVEETKNLIAVHNSTEEKLLGALKLGGLPSPSIAITKNDMSHEKFGDISLVFRKDSINPTDRRNKIYSGDAYTPTGVRVEYDVDDDVLQEFNKRLKELTPEWAKERLPSVDSGTAEAENDSLYRAYERNDRAKFAFLREKGKAPKIAMRTPRLSTFVSNDTVIALAKAFSAKQLSDIANTSEGVKQYKNAFLKVIRDNEDSIIVAHGIYSADEASLYDIAETARVAEQVKRNRYKIKKEIDFRNTFALIDKRFTKALKEEYRAWIDENTKDAIIDKGIRNNRDLFTPSGKRRTFKQLHEPYNLSNIIKQMFSGEDKGIALFGGSPIGAAQHEYSSIADVKADSGRLQQLEQEEHDKMRDQIEADVFELARKMQIRSDVFAVRDLLSEAIGKKTKQQADTHLKRESQGWANYSPEFTNELWDIRERILNMPTGYFEAKPQRAVTFNEVALAVLPKGKTALRRMLEDAGVQKVVYYDKNKDGDRLAKINSVADVSFSLKGTSDISSKDRKELLDIIEHLKGEFEITKFAKADPKKLAKMTKDLLKEYDSQADYDETYNAIDELYKYMANGEEGHPPVWEDVYNRAYDVARNIVKNALVTDDYMYQEYKSLRDYLRNTPMKFYAGYDSVPSSYENFNDFRKQNMGRLKFTNDGMAIDSVYQELASMYPEFFDAEEQINSADMLERIVDVLDELQPSEVNPFDRQVEQVSMHLASDLASRFFDIPQAKPTFADKAERRVVEAHIKGGKRVEAVRQQKDAKIKKLIEAQKEKTKKQLDKIREQRDTKLKKEQEKRRVAISKMSESQKAKVLRARIMRHTSDLSKKLVNPTDNQHIPSELQGAVAKLLECINLESNYTYDVASHSYKKNDDGLPTRRTQAFNELKKVYADIASSVVVDPDLMGENGLLSDVISLADKRIVDMTSSELETVWQTIRAIEASVSTANKVFSQGKFETILEFAEALREDNAGKKEKTSLKGVLGKGKKLATLDMLTPETYLHYLGGAGDSIFRMMRDAQDKHISIMKEVADFTRKTVKDVDVNSLEKTLHTVKLGGEEVQLSTAQLMELYVLMKREQAVEHILVGGILPDVTKGKGLKLNTKAEPIRNLSMREISAAISKLTDKQKKIADELQKFVSTVLSEYGNEASMKVYNYEKFLEKNYWTIRTNKQEIGSEIGKDTAVTSVANKGMAKGTVPHANTSVRIGSIFDTFSAHSSDMATYAAWLGTSEDVNRIRNFVFWEDGVRTGTVKGILDTVHGIHGSEYLQKLLTDVAIGVKGTDNMNPFDKLIGSYKAGSVGANLRVVIQQPTAILRALDMINPIYLTEGALRLNNGWKQAKKYAPIAQWKDWGHFDINTGRQMKDVLFDNASVLEKTKQVGMWGASKADSISWGLLWNAVEAETKAKHKDLEVGSDAYYKTVSKRFTEIVDHTQVVDGILQRSQIMRSPDALTKMATSFMGEPTKQYNMAVAALNDVLTGKGDARKKAATRLGRTATALAVAGLINACAQSIIDAMRDDDKEKDYWEKWLAAFIGDGEETNLLSSNIGDTVNPLNYIPFAKDIVSVMQGYDVKRMDTESITKTFNAVTNMYKAVTGSGKYTIAEASAQLFAEIARLFGVPVANVKRDVKSLVMSTAIQTDSYLLQYRMEKAMLNINYAGNSKNFMDILFNAYNNDREAYEFIYNDMLESGYEAEKIESGMETRMKKAEGVEKASELSKRYMNPENEKQYDNSLNRIKSSKAWKSANAEQRKNAEADLYEFLTSDTEDMIKTRAEAGTYGVDETEYTLWQLAIEMADQPKGQKGSGSYDYKEKAEAINSLNLGERETAYFFGKGLNESSKEELSGALNAGIDIQEYANFKAAVSEMKADKNANGKSIPNSKKRKVVNYLNNADITYDEWAYFYYEIMNYKK